tara:strand:- start:2316 stop:2906 length:591 start_codon:yes stop_codon:yes gene_type:complete
MEGQTSEEFRKAFAKFQNIIKNPELDQTNPHFRSKYASLASCLKVVKPALKESGLMLYQRKTYANDDCYMITSLICIETGDGIVDSSKLKASARVQEFGSEQTYAKRYGICTVCGIVGEEDDDGNNHDKPTPKSESKPLVEGLPITEKQLYKLRENWDLIIKHHAQLALKLKERTITLDECRILLDKCFGKLEWDE